MNIELYEMSHCFRVMSHAHTVTRSRKRVKLTSSKGNDDSYSEFKSINNKLKKDYNHLFVAVFVF